MSTSVGLSGLPGKSGVSGTTSDAPEEATQRPPFLALRGPSHSHPGALLHRRRRITLWQTTSPATSGPSPWGGGDGRTRASRVDWDDRLLRQRLLRQRLLRQEVLRREVLRREVLRRELLRRELLRREVGGHERP